MLSALTYSIARWIRYRIPARLAGASRGRSIGIAILCASISLAGISCNDGTTHAASTPAAASAYPASQPVAQPPVAVRTNIGFRSRKLLNEHFAKHGDEFGNVTQQQYLRLAQTLRDEPAGGNVLEIRRSDGTTSRYDRTSGAFIAFNANGTIRTFFKPNNGETYFRRQATQAH